MIGNLEQVPGKIPWAVHSKDCNVMLHHHNFHFLLAQACKNFPRQFLQCWLEEVNNKRMGQEEKKDSKIPI